MLSVVMESAERWVDASLRVREMGEARDLRWPEWLLHSSVNRDRSKQQMVSVVQTRKEDKQLA
jgi:hypothetical protein